MAACVCVCSVSVHYRHTVNSCLVHKLPVALQHNHLLNEPESCDLMRLLFCIDETYS